MCDEIVSALSIGKDEAWFIPAIVVIGQAHAAKIQPRFHNKLALGFGWSAVKLDKSLNITRPTQTVLLGVCAKYSAMCRIFGKY
jgi:hypothetical protein